LIRRGVTRPTRCFYVQDMAGNSIAFEWVKTDVNNEWRLVRVYDRFVVAYFGKRMCDGGLSHVGTLRVYPSAFQIVDLVVASLFVTLERKDKKT